MTPMLLRDLCLLLALTFSYVLSAVLSCPHQCQCEANVTQCSHLSLTEAPTKGYPLKTLLLNLSHNQICSLNCSSLPMYELFHLHTLILSHNHVTPQCLGNLMNLRIVDLSYNNIVLLNPYTFKYNLKLTWLSLSGNPLFLIQSGSFVVSQSLSHLCMTHCSLHTVPNNTFKLVNNVRTLDLSHNQICILPEGAFNGLSGMQHLDLSYNRLVTLSARVLLPALSSNTFVTLRGNDQMCVCHLQLLNLRREMPTGVVEDDCDTMSEAVAVVTGYEMQVAGCDEQAEPFNGRQMAKLSVQKVKNRDSRKSNGVSLMDIGWYTLLGVMIIVALSMTAQLAAASRNGFNHRLGESTGMCV